ncbi:MAG: Co2+/Mg2+ efflux protein ApaG [Ignavibacteriae bacterium]|nr:Co2+/Mg2+ efflux protein ApaG [Ignavibacteria bacterium]MBI3364723.1 Co2+/Mg2+ efflux protein ApaG [Ignavibacteriota bacterium]
MFVATTDTITIKVKPMFIDGQSDPIEHKLVFAYFVSIENHGTEPVQLLRRHWFINHGGGRVEEVEGEGVVGQQPVIQPGKAYDYNSFCVLDTYEGTMEGTYLIQRTNGEYFRAAIPRFILRAYAN